MRILIDKHMEPIAPREQEKFDNYIRKTESYDCICQIIDTVVITNKITLVVFKYNDIDDCVAWAFYPRSGVQEYVDRQKDNERNDDFVERCINKLLHQHNWLDNDVAHLIEQRKYYTVATDTTIFKSKDFAEIKKYYQRFGGKVVDWLGHSIVEYFLLQEALHGVEV